VISWAGCWAASPVAHRLLTFPPAINTAWLALATRAILHAIENIEQSHVFNSFKAPPSVNRRRQTSVGAPPGVYP
jgi:hypothetical protein